MGKSTKVTYTYANEDEQKKVSQLEEFLFGAGSAANKLLMGQDGAGSITELVRQAELSPADDDKADEGDDDLLFFEDRGGDDAERQQEAAGPGPGSLKLQQQEQQAGKGSRKRKPIWSDRADEAAIVQIATAARLRKLRQHKNQTQLSGAEYAAALRRQHAALHPRTSWAISNRAAAAWHKAGAAAAEIDDLREPDEDTAEQLLLSGSGSLLGGNSGGRGGLLAPGVLELSRLRDANGASPSEAVVQAMQFHPNGQLMLTAGFDKRLKLFQVDGLRNPLVQSLYLQDCPIHTAAFAAGGNIVVAAGRRPCYYIADLHTGQLERVVTPPSMHHQGPANRNNSSSNQSSGSSTGSKGRSNSSKGSGSKSSGGMKSCESFAASSDPSRPWVAFLGDAGHIGLVSLRSRTPVGTLKMNGSARAATFSRDGSLLFTAGSDGVLYTWDLRSQRCLHQQRDEGAIGCSSLAVSPDGSYLATGSPSGVVNVYKRPAGLLRQITAASLQTSNGDQGGVLQAVDRQDSFGIQQAAALPLKALMNLTTTIDTLAFNHDSQLLLLGSRLKKDSLRLVHLPSLTVYSNWPTSRSPLQYVHSAAFSPHSGFLSIGNAKGRALLYRLHHFPEV